MGFQEDFINEISAHVVAWCDYLGYGVPSAIIAQACLESGYGRSDKAVNYHNYFGLKYKPGRCNCNDGYFTATSAEQLPDGTYVTISTQWFSFPDMHTGVEGYMQFINISRYAKIKDATDPETYLSILKEGGYATSINYVTNCMNIVTKYNLTQYDKGGSMTPDSPIAQGITVSTSTYGLRSKKPDLITIHHMGCFPSPTAKNQCERFANPSRRASATYCIGNAGDCWQGLPEMYAPWTSSSKTNDMRAITIEVANSSGAPNWEISQAALTTLYLLLADVCKRNGINKLIWSDIKSDRVNHKNGCNCTMHRDFVSTTCPGPFIASNMRNITTVINNLLAVPAPSQGYYINGVDYSPVFDPEYYANRYADLEGTFGHNASALWDHFCNFGMDELRQAKADFDPVYYKNRYVDLREAFGDNNPAYYNHYIVFGIAEGRAGHA